MLHQYLLTAAILLVQLAGLGVPPVAREVPYTVRSPSGDRVDEYYWLRDDSQQKRPEIIEYLTAENAFTESMTASIKPLEATLLAEMRGRIKEDDSQPPIFDHGYWYWMQFATGAEYPQYLRQQGSADSFPQVATSAVGAQATSSGKAPLTQVMLDGPEMAKGKPFFSVGSTAVSPDNNWLAWTDDFAGRRTSTLRCKDLRTGVVAADAVPGVLESIAWAADSRTLFYIRQDPVLLQSGPVFRHELGTPIESDVLVYEEADPTLIVDIALSASRRFIVLLSEGFDVTEIRAVDAEAPSQPPTVVWPRTPGVRTYGDHLAGKWVMSTNLGARNFKLVEAGEASASDQFQWRELVPNRDAVYLEDFELFSGAIALQERADANCVVRVIPWGPAPAFPQPFSIKPEEAAFTVSLSDNPDPASPWVRVLATSMITPRTLLDVSLSTHEAAVRKVQAVIGYDPEQYGTDRVWAKARDGQRVPVSIAWRKDRWKQDGSAPIYQEGYGSYGISSEAEFSSSQVSLLDRGFLMATAHIRGGADLGQDWYEAGRLMHKQNTFNDFEDVTDFLVSEGYGAKDRVFASGSSAGGLLMGAIANQAGLKYRGMGLHVPFVDAVTTMLDESIPLTANEWTQWGDPREKPAYEYILSYSPYDRIERKRYPAMLVTAGLWDSQVQYFEPAKYVARLRARKTDGNPLLLRVNMDAGHGGNSGRYERLKETALEYAFFIELLGQ